MKEVEKLIAAECDGIKQLLLTKNREYGNSVFEPIGIFAGASAREQICVRIDDKLKRIQNTRGKETEIKEDTVLDLIGYLVLLRVQEQLARHYRADRPSPTPVPSAGQTRE